MITLKSYAAGEWVDGTGRSRIQRHAVTGEEIAQLGSEGVDFAAMLANGREKGGPALREMTFPQRGAILKKMSGVLNGHRDELNEIAASYGATAKDAELDVDGDIKAEVRCLRAVQINAYNFPSWGMLEKLGPALLAGMPSIVKPASPSAWLTFRIVEILIESGVVPDGALQLICGSVGDLFDHLTHQDLVSFTGSAATAEKIRAHKNIVANAVRVNIEADSLNCIVLGPDVEPGSDTFEFFKKEVVREMTVKAGQKCTAIRRVLVPAERADDVVSALKDKLASIRVGDPGTDGVRMGPLVDDEALRAAREGIATLSGEAEIVYGDPSRTDFEPKGGAFMEPVLLLCRQGSHAKLVHEVEVFGPAATVLGYRDVDEAIELARKGGGSLVGSIFTEDEDFAAKATFGLAAYHGRLMVMDAKSSPESTGHGVAMPQLVHGGPGRAGGGEELGGVRSVYHYMQRVALQGDPERLERMLAPASQS